MIILSQTTEMTRRNSDRICLNYWAVLALHSHLGPADLHCDSRRVHGNLVGVLSYCWGVHNQGDRSSLGEGTENRVLWSVGLGHIQPPWGDWGNRWGDWEARGSNDWGTRSFGRSGRDSLDEARRDDTGVRMGVLGVLWGRNLGGGDVLEVVDHRDQSLEGTYVVVGVGGSPLA